jgi:hypothetical protein
MPGQQRNKKPNGSIDAHVADCLDGRHGPVDAGNRCIYCNETTAITPAQYDAGSWPNITALLDAASAPERMGDAEGNSHPGGIDIVYVDGPLSGRTQVTPEGATVIVELTLTPLLRPVVGSLYRPEKVAETWYRIDGDRAYHLWDRALTDS